LTLRVLSAGSSTTLWALKVHRSLPSAVPKYLATDVKQQHKNHSSTLCLSSEV